MIRFLTLAVLAAATTTLHASIMYSAFISCPNCVTISLGWTGEPTPVSWAQVNDLNGAFVLSLNVGPPPRQNGFINPNPQTISGLSQHDMFVITGGQVGVFSVASPFSPIANMTLWTAMPSEGTGGGILIDSTPFIADVDVVPEPAVWSLTGAGIALLVLWKRRRRNSQT